MCVCIILRRVLPNLGYRHGKSLLCSEIGNSAYGYNVLGKLKETTSKHNMKATHSVEIKQDKATKNTPCNK